MNESNQCATTTFATTLDDARDAHTNALSSMNARASRCRRRWMRVDVCPHIDAQGAFDTTRPRSTVTGRRLAPRDARHARDAR